MGVRGLTTFFNQNPDLFKPFLLHDMTVIIDGNNLIHALYSSYRVNFMFGGDYKKYSDGIRKYFSVYLECNIKPVIIFDGGYEKSKRKLRTTIDRSSNRLSQVRHIVKHGCCSGMLLPILAYEIFYSVLRELNIPFANCDYEADDQITALANYWKCPVISGDSDFYIFDIQHGFIHLNFIDTDICKKTDSDGKEYKCLECKIYCIERFISYFPGLDKKALPLFGTLMGNDFVSEGEFRNFFSNIPLPKYKGCRLIGSAKQKKMMGLLRWLQTNNLDEAVDEIVQFMKKRKREYIKFIIKSSVDGYESYFCSLLSQITQNEGNVKDEFHSQSRLTSPCNQVLPIDFILKFHNGHLPSFFVNVIVSHRVFLQPQIEVVSFVSSYSCSLHIRQIMYGILVRHDVDAGECNDEACLSPIEEYDRQGNNLSKELVNPVFELEGFGALPKLNEVPQLPQSKCKDIMLKALAVEHDTISCIPEKWQLYVACVNFWLRNCDPCSSQAFVFALTLNWIYSSLIKVKDVNQNQNNCEICKNAKSPCQKVSCILSRISDSELKSVEKRLEKYTHKPAINHGNPLLLAIIHSYSQLQSVVLYSIYLNKLLNTPFESIHLDRCFCGTFLYNVAKDTSSRSNPELFAAEILGRDSNVHSLFLQMNLVVCENVLEDRITKNVPFVKRSKKSKKSRNVPGLDEITDEDLDILNLSDLNL